MKGLVLLTSLLGGAVLAAAYDPMPFYPSDGLRTPINPPSMSWPQTEAGKRSNGYTLEMQFPDGDTRRWTAPHNWLTFDKVLPAGDYRWRVLDSGATPWRTFTISKRAPALPIPSPAALWGTAQGRPHPRTLSIPRLKAAANPGEERALADKVKWWQQEPLPVEPPMGTSVSALTKNRALVFGEEDRILAAALAWLQYGSRSGLTEARRHALNLARLDPNGMTGFAAHDQAGRSVAWVLALAFDWLHDEWSNAERQQLLAAIEPRLAGMLGSGNFGLDHARRLDVNPFNSHGVTALSRSAVICAALAGEGQIYDDCFQETVPRYLAWPMPWGRDAGGFANGTAYAQWAVLDTQLPVWDMLANAIGVDIAQTPWARHHIQYLAYFLPPGAPSGLFGDDAETRFPGVWATQAKAYAAQLPSPLADWYARNQFGENPIHLALLLAPANDWSKVPGALPVGTPQAAYLDDIGWVAMHSNLGDRARTSVYFKSSPYGSYNHSHADQNSFVIHARGQALAIDSGYYDYYGSPHWKDWYKQTRAHNAITFDGGQGQLHDTMAAKGKITQFEHHPSYDITTGDATAAYGAALTHAVRSIVYLRPNTLLVYDALQSDTPRTWEWNIHALSRMKEVSGHAVEIEQLGARLCVSMLEAPPGAFAQTGAFTTAPQGNHPGQWHARYATQSKSNTAHFLALLDVECSKPAITLRTDGDNRVVTLSGRRFVFNNTGSVVVAH